MSDVSLLIRTSYRCGPRSRAGLTPAAPETRRDDRRLSAERKDAGHVDLDYFFGASTVTMNASVNVTVTLSPTFNPSRFFLSSTVADIE